MAKGTIIQPDKGKNKKGNKVNKKSLRKKLKTTSKNISALYPNVKVVTLPNGSTQVEYGDDYFDEKIWASNGGKHPYKGQDLLENYIANQVLSGSMYQQDGYRALDLVTESKSLGDLVDTMHKEGWYVWVGDLDSESWGAHRVSHTCFWMDTSADLLNRKTLVEKIIHESETIERTDENLRTIETMFIDYDLEYISEGPKEASKLLQTRLRMKFGGHPKIELDSSLDLVKRKTLSLEEATEQMKQLELSSSAAEWGEKVRHGNQDYQYSYENDPFMRRRYDLVKQDAGTMNAPQCLFSILGTQAENFLIKRNSIFNAGDPNDWDWVDEFRNFDAPDTDDPETFFHEMKRRRPLSEILEPERKAWGRQQAALQYFKQSLKCPGMFAIPTWWYGETMQAYSIRVSQYLTRDFDEPFPFGSMTSIISRTVDWIERQEQTNLDQYKQYIRESNDYLSDRIAAQTYPEMVPFNTTFINLEDESIAGHLIYQRQLGQTGQVRQHMVPTSAHGPDGRLVPLDLIFHSGFYFRECEEANPLGRKVIYGLYHGYVINTDYCPDGLDFIRIPMVCPFHVDGQWFPNKPEFPGQRLTQSVVIPVIDMMIDALNEHKVVVRNFSRSERKKSVKVSNKEGVKVTPRRYSRVTMSAGSTNVPPIEDCPLMQLPKWKLTKRIKCRKHERCYIQHGRLPLEVEHKELLLSRGYMIYTDNLDVGPRDYKRLSLRGIEMPNGYRWVAIRTIIIDEHKRGPEGKELVPLVLVPQDKVMKQSTEFELNSIPTK